MNFLFLAAFAGESVDVQPAISTLAQTVIGSLLVLSWAISLLAIWQLIKVQNARVEDQKASNDKVSELNEKMTLAFSGMQSTLEGLRRSEEGSQQVMSGMKATLDLMLTMRQLRPSTGTMPAVQDPRRR